MAIMEVFKDFTIDCAHSLPNVPDGHKCKNVHGHTYKIRVVLKGEIDPVLGWVFDFAEIKTAFEPLKEILDHKYINDVDGLENPTAEKLALDFESIGYRSKTIVRNLGIRKTHIGYCL